MRKRSVQLLHPVARAGVPLPAAVAGQVSQDWLPLTLTERFFGTDTGRGGRA